METRRRRITGCRTDSNMRRICRYLPCLSVTINQELLPGFTVFYLAGCQPFSGETNAAAQAVEKSLGGLTSDFDPVVLGHATGFGQSAAQVPVVGQDNQPLALVVKPSNRIESNTGFHKIGHCPPVLFVPYGTDDSAGLVESVVLQRLRLNAFPVHPDVVARRVCTDSQLAHHTPIQLDRPGPGSILPPYGERQCRHGQ